VILDLWMERQDTGWTIYGALQSDDATARIPVLVCSADITALQVHAAALDERGDAALEKPFNIVELLTLIDRLLGRFS
jgi:CheY-like chemotaxis protein